MPKQTDPYALDELAARQQHAKSMGGEQRIARQHSRDRLTVRERIDYLLDSATFDELGALTHSDIPDAAQKTPADGKVVGFGRIEGRTVFVSGDDATVMAGAGGRIGVQKQYEGAQYALQKGYPIVHLGDGGGARIPDIMGAVGMMRMVYPVKGAPRNRYVPQITTIMGDCYGGPSWTAAMSDIVIQVKGAYMAVAGPPVLEAATGEQVSPEKLGGWELHAHTTGLVDLFAEDEHHCLNLTRRVLSYFPSNADWLPPVISTDEAPHRPIENFEALIPADPNRTYNMHAFLDEVFDAESIIDLKPDYDGSLITALARLDGHPVGILANNPQVMVGAMGPGACEKATAFITLCDSFHIPLIFLHDTPGFFVSEEAERRKMSQKIMTFIQALQLSTVPRVSLIVRKSYGMAHCNMVGGNMGADILLAFPTAEVSFMAPTVAVNVMFGRKLAEMTDPETVKQAFLDEMQSQNEIWEAAGLNLVDKVIHPSETRKELVNALARARGIDGTQGMSQRHLANWTRMT